jgi:hypothetical protein
VETISFLLLVRDIIFAIFYLSFGIYNKISQLKDSDNITVGA